MEAAHGGADFASQLQLKRGFAQLPHRGKIQLKLEQRREASRERACTEAFPLWAGMV